MSSSPSFVAEVVVRFGRDVLLRLDQALGDVPEIVRPELFVEPVAACWTFEDATAQRWVLEKAIERLLQELLERLAPEQLGIERLTCELRTTAAVKRPVNRRFATAGYHSVIC